MRFYSLLAAAKINLYLEIVGSRPDGFHELIMVMQSVSLCDRVTVRSIGIDEIRVRCDHPLVPADETNLAYRAAALVVEQFPGVMAKLGGVEITIEKQIPVGAGLAGGSSNAAAVLVGLDLLWNLGLTQSELQELGAVLGSDIPFCVSGGTAIATGRGEQLDPLPGIDDLHLVLAKYESEFVSTPWAYKTYQAQYGTTYLADAQSWQERQSQVRSGEIVTAVSHRNPKELGQHLYNDFEKVVLPAHPKTAALKTAMADLGGMGTLMSGSGPSVFTLAESEAAAEALATKLRAALPDSDLGVWTARFVSGGVQLDG
ncbi:4-(cytidine 5'-diphospho)-2-C-methyl-D-erythritol kinase [Nodosilinea sp. LEGE 07088]|uniref:4-(cytidine 5'-diphospho)-2-C-methyl-D-erythritol kinase n=1 Tax=Nodosilinea sp. LEGE 07088 TaxID=2777968 RepID=UPI001881B995|nr:4-(cytidine 5'-diphospho)-2-C-methyl-D-erythritol kinase [Nodosilinea sp. LEGE 07088]MBE9140150.1 4-(cytidine 5'-diphospho)-2-C-methyl-D-erythritol kinase [Nodosilinea sp. LEGE 07088]